MPLDVTAAVRDVVHDLRSSLGSIRLVLTSALDEPDDELPAVRPLLVGAEAEARRLAAALAAISALVETGVAAPPGPVDCADLFDAAAADALRRDARVNVGRHPGQVVVPGSAAVVLGALCSIVAGEGASVDLTSEVEDGRVIVSLSTVDAPLPRLPNAAVRHLASALGATLGDATDAVRLRLAMP